MHLVAVPSVSLHPRSTRCWVPVPGGFTPRLGRDTPTPGRPNPGSAPRGCPLPDLGCRRRAGECSRRGHTHTQRCPCPAEPRRREGRDRSAPRGGGGGGGSGTGGRCSASPPHTHTHTHGSLIRRLCSSLGACQSPPPRAAEERSVAPGTRPAAPSPRHGRAPLPHPLAGVGVRADSASPGRAEGPRPGPAPAKRLSARSPPAQPRPCQGPPGKAPPVSPPAPCPGTARTCRARSPSRPCPRSSAEPYFSLTQNHLNHRLPPHPPPFPFTDCFLQMGR